MAHRDLDNMYRAFALIFTLSVMVVDGRSLSRRWYSGVYQNVTWECTQPGPMCSSCNEVSICVLSQRRDGSQFYQQLQVDTCTADEGCSHLTGRCSQHVGECYGGMKFRCHTPGIFPDPYECNVYYTCGAVPQNLDESVEYDYDKQLFCARGAAFNAATGQCDLTKDADVCQYNPVPKCEHFLQTGSLQSNPNIYYACVNVSGKGIQPKLYRCTEDEFFDADDYVCRSKLQSTAKAVSTTTASTTTTTTTAAPTTTTRFTPPNGEFYCVAAGDYPDPKDCHKYYRCDGVGTPPHHNVCLWWGHFNAVQGTCELGPCW